MMHLPADNIAGFADSYYWSSSEYSSSKSYYYSFTSVIGNAYKEVKLYVRAVRAF